MGKATGRKQSPGKRTKSGRLSRAGKKPTDAGQASAWVQQQVARYGQYYNSAIGRAYASGLLDDPADGNRALDRYQKARKFAALYRRVIGGESYRCALDQSPRGGMDHYEPSQRDIDDQEWLIVNMARLDQTGCRPFFDQLTSRLYTDHGPSWLDAILDAKHKDRRDTMVLDAAIKAIDALGPVQSKAREIPQERRAA